MGMKKKERSREKQKKKGKLVELTTQKLWGLQSSKIYVGDIELCISVFENIHFLFSISITLTRIFGF